MEFSEFERLSHQYDGVVLARKLLSDGWTPVSAFQKLDEGGTACLFESVIGGEKVGRYSFLTIQPIKTITAWQNKVVVWTDNHPFDYHSENPLEFVREEIRQLSVAPHPELPPFAGGAIGYAGYDTIRYVEHLPDAPENDRELPDMFFAFYDQMVVFDHITKTMYLIAIAWPGRASSLSQAYQEANTKLDNLESKLTSDHQPACSYQLTATPEQLPEFDSNMTREEFENAVTSCVEYIEAGDIFQVVISQRFKTNITCDPFEIYRTLRVLNPSPFMFFVRTPDTTLVGSSPEIMCRVVDGKVTVRPLAGTRRRGADDIEDRDLEQELLADPKERAEHVMLVDLGRNDVGRVAQYGTVELPEVMTVERYSHVMHLSSTVHGQLRPELDSFDALMASLPAGTVSGAPKVRAMEIIDEMEKNRRGPYAGAVGYIDFSGNMDTCIALRTIVIKNKVAYVQAGAGIVADSQPAAEYAETQNKAMGLLRAIQVTQERIKK